MNPCTCAVDGLISLSLERPRVHHVSRLAEIHIPCGTLFRAMASSSRRCPLVTVMARRICETAGIGQISNRLKSWQCVLGFSVAIQINREAGVDARPAHGIMNINVSLMLTRGMGVTPM